MYNGLIYLITNNVNGKLYVGQTRRTLEQRWKSHVADRNRFKFPLALAMCKYGIENFSIRELYHIECCDESYLVRKLNEMETHFIRLHKTLIDFGNGYNLTTGGEGYTVSESTKLKMRNAKLGRKLSAETKSKIRQSLLGRETLDSTRKLLSLRFSGKNHPNFGKRLSEKTRQAMRKPHKKKGDVSIPLVDSLNLPNSSGVSHTYCQRTALGS